MRTGRVIALLAATCGAANAQSTVTLYGIVDDGITYSSNVGGHAAFILDSGILQGSRYGFLINEALGAGLRTIARIEYGFNASNGTLTNGGALRQSYVGLSSARWGQMTFGRQFDPIAEFAVYDTLCAYVGIYACSALDVDRIAGEAISNSAKYVSPEWGGFKFGALYGFSNQAGAFGGTRGAPRWTSAAVTFDDRQRFSAAVGFTHVNGAGGSIAQIVTGATAQQVFDAAARYKLDAITMLASYRRSRLTGETGGVSSTANNYEAGALYAWSPALQLSGGYTHSVWTQGRWGTFALGIDYLLSRSTDVYASSLYQKSYSAGVKAALLDVNNAIGNPGAPNEAGASSTDRQFALRIGIRTKF